MSGGLYSCAQIVGGNILNVARDAPCWRGFGFINGEVGGFESMNGEAGRSLNVEEFWTSARGGVFKRVD